MIGPLFQLCRGKKKPDTTFVVTKLGSQVTHGIHRGMCFVHVCFQICFAPQRRALFRHLNFQTASAMRCFEHLDFQMCFAPQQRAIFDLSPAPATLAILLFDPPVPHGATEHWKNTVFRDFSIVPFHAR